jgi:myo-inositol-1(or 4)-monophosphatase
MSEESGLTEGEEGVWVIDPVDGTSNFILGMDHWCISVAYVRQNRIALGIIFAPDRDEFFFATAGEGAWLNDRRLTLTDPAPDAVVIGLGRLSAGAATTGTAAVGPALLDVEESVAQVNQPGQFGE